VADPVLGAHLARDGLLRQRATTSGEEDPEALCQAPDPRRQRASYVVIRLPPSARGVRKVTLTA
jgi:hypothetical protein